MKANVKSHVTVVHWKMIDEVSAHDVHRLKFMRVMITGPAQRTSAGSIKVALRALPQAPPGGAFR
ncbi:MAG TPA: hypothetical protein VGO27_20070 [Candidatus Acidoferrum sp.]|nr:hypothetical protein [Candidatus Acidoferrum sp.]